MKKVKFGLEAFYFENLGFSYQFFSPRTTATTCRLQGRIKPVGP